MPILRAPWRATRCSWGCGLHSRAVKGRKRQDEHRLVRVSFVTSRAEWERVQTTAGRAATVSRLIFGLRTRPHAGSGRVGAKCGWRVSPQSKKLVDFAANKEVSPGTKWMMALGDEAAHAAAAVSSQTVCRSWSRLLPSAFSLPPHCVTL